MTRTQKLKMRLLYPLVYALMAALSLLARVRTFGRRPVVHFEQPYTGGRILLLALYQKGHLRADVMNLLRTAKAEGCYVVAVNTLRLSRLADLEGHVDCYIERPNFGRDFGSYKLGLHHIYRRGWDRPCDRLLMLNDSVYFSKRDLASFLRSLVSTDLDVVGATETFEIQHHLGSFCISLDRSILQHRRFRRFWRHYVRTDVRRRVIMHGEMALSRTLQRCVRSPEHFGALYGLAWFAEHLDRDAEVLDRAFALQRSSGPHAWQRSSLRKVMNRFQETYLFTGVGHGPVPSGVGPTALHFVDGPERLVNVLAGWLPNADEELVRARVLQEARNDLMEAFTAGSQIHSNGILLHDLGMPLVKLDGLYRGAFLVGDVEKIARRLSEEERPAFRRLMYAKPYGDTTLRGWRRAAFNVGLL